MKALAQIGAWHNSLDRMPAVILYKVICMISLVLLTYNENHIIRLSFFSFNLRWEESDAAAVQTTKQQKNAKGQSLISMIVSTQFWS